MNTEPSIDLRTIVQAARDNWQVPNFYTTKPVHLGDIRMVDGQFIAYRVVTKEAQHVIVCNSIRDLAVALDLLSQPEWLESECVAAYHLYQSKLFLNQFNF